VVISEKLKKLRETKELSQGDIGKRTGLLRCYISRVENGHTVPSVDTLEKMDRALEVPLYRLFTDDAHVKKPAIIILKKVELRPFAKALSHLNDRDRKLVLQVASRMACRA